MLAVAMVSRYVEWKWEEVTPRLVGLTSTVQLAI